MKTKWLGATLVAIAAGGALLWLWLAADDVGRSASGAASADVLEPASSAGAQDSALLVRPGETSGSAGGVAADESGRAPVHTEEAPAARVRPGKLVLHAIDQRTGAPLRSPCVRLGSAVRFGQFDGNADLDVWLTPGMWDGSIHAAGYEHYTLQNVSIRSGDTTDLGILALEPGSGRIEGAVRFPDAGADAVATIELIGEARHPCPSCSAPEPGAEADAEERDPYARDTPCTACGFSAERSVRAVHPGESYGFANLAGGNYLVRVLGRDGQAYAREQRVALQPRGRVWLDLDAEVPRELDFRLTWEDGAVFDGRWEENGEPQQENIRFHFLRGETEIASATFLAQAHNVRIQFDGGNLQLASGVYRTLASEIAGQLRPGDLLTQKLVYDFNYDIDGVRSDNLGRLLSVSFARAEPEPEPEPADRERTADDTLWPIPDWPQFAAGEVHLSWIEAGTFRIGPLLCEDITVQAECTPFRSDRVRLDTGACAGADTALVMHSAPLSVQQQALIELDRILRQRLPEENLSKIVVGEGLEISLQVEARRQD